MVFQRMLNDIISLIKSDGQQYNNIKAHVQPDMIFISDATLPIEEGDKLIRELPSGLIESYIVLDRGFYSKVRTIPAHYQVKVRKESSVKEKQQSAQTIVETLIAGDQINLSDIKNSSFSIKSTSQKINSLSFGSNAEKKELIELIENLIASLKQVPSVAENEVEKILKRVEILLDDLNSEKPDNSRIEITSESLITAAQNLAKTLPFVLPIAQQIVSTIQKMLP